MALFSHIISAVDTHAGGEPARIVLHGLPLIHGNTMLEKKIYLMENLDTIRILLMQEPRGHHDMFGVVLTEPISETAHYGALFMDTSGYIDMCVHGIIATTTALIETGTFQPCEPLTSICFDTPAGKITTSAKVQDNKVLEVSVSNVPSFLSLPNLHIHLPEVGEIEANIAFGGNFFALVSVPQFGISILPNNAAELIHWGLIIKEKVNQTISVTHPTTHHISSVSLTKFYEHPDSSKPFSKSAVIFGNGQLDRCPCGTGTSAMMAYLYAKGELGLGVTYTSEGIIGTQFTGKLIREIQLGEFRAVEPVITGSAYLTGIQQFVLDPSDPIQSGFLLKR